MTNETLKTILERKSCRSYKSEQITKEELDAVVKAGLAAPSGRNLQNAIIVAVTDPETIAKLSKMNAAIMGTENDPFYGAPCVCVVLAKSGERTSFEDGCLVMGNMLLAAYSMGLGCCWIHRAREMFDTEEGKELLEKWGVEDDVYGVGNCILGYPNAPFHEPFETKEGRLFYVR